MDKALQRELRREWKRIAKELTPRIKAAVEKQPGMDVGDAIRVVVTQNLLRDCLTVGIEQSLPVRRSYFVELATRLAAYCITALPFDEHETAAMIVREGLLPKLADMQANGFVIETGWEP